MHIREGVAFVGGGGRGGYGQRIGVIVKMQKKVWGEGGGGKTLLQLQNMSIQTAIIQKKSCDFFTFTPDNLYSLYITSASTYKAKKKINKYFSSFLFEKQMR